VVTARTCHSWRAFAAFSPRLVDFPPVIWCVRHHQQAIKTMTENIVPHFHNDVGVAEIEIGAKEFMCIGAMPPFDHPHVFCDMGDDNEYVCPYCSTLYRYNPALKANEARPPECALKSEPV
jgi:uncharacterized Zn-finger protein